jgi:poly(3-hydroxybutyrate) depolymerase
MHQKLSMLLLLLAAQTLLHTATHHPMQYYLSLPPAWKKGGHWPVVVVIDSADREFKGVASAFAAARGARTYIIVTPLVVTNGGPRAREVPSYHYSPAVWARDPWEIDSSGLRAVLDEVSAKYGGSSVFITGLEAAGHTVYAAAFSHPTWFRGVALVSPNYAGRWVPAPVDGRGLPLRVFVGANDALAPRFAGQQRAQALASAHGYAASQVPDVVLKWFDTLR